MAEKGSGTGLVMGLASAGLGYIILSNANAVIPFLNQPVPILGQVLGLVGVAFGVYQTAIAGMGLVGKKL